MTSGYSVLVVLDVGGRIHHAVGLDPTGKRAHDGSLPNNQPKLQTDAVRTTSSGNFVVGRLLSPSGDCRGGARSEALGQRRQAYAGQAPLRGTRLGDRTAAVMFLSASDVDSPM